MKLAVITPTHAKVDTYLRQAYESLLQQTMRDFCWLVLSHNGAPISSRIKGDPRVKILQREGLCTIGDLKRTLTMAAEADVIVELDHDDMLMPTALADIVERFSQGADVVYSDFAEFLQHGEGDGIASWGAYPYAEAYGWEHYQVAIPRRMPHVGGRSLIAMRAPDVTSQNLRLIEWTPNHVRAWRRSTYERIGGHDDKLLGADDHDLMVRMYLAGARFERIDKCLYLYRVHGENYVQTNNDLIRMGTRTVYHRHIEALAQKFAVDQDLEMIDLCGAIDRKPGYKVLDSAVPEDGQQPFIQQDLNESWRVGSNCVGVIRAVDAIEHLRDPVHVMNEAHRVLAPGGFLLIEVPSTSGKGAFCDPTHVSFWNDLSFRYYTDERFSKYVRAFDGAFQELQVFEHFPSPWHRERNVPYVTAHLCKLGAGYKPMGEVKWSSRLGRADR